MVEWKTMDSFPKNASEYLVCKDNFIDIVYFDSFAPTNKCLVNRENRYFFLTHFDYWTKLPELPKLLDK